MKLVGLVRVSGEKQRGKNDEGLQRQRDAIAAIALREGVTDVTLVEVTDVSGSDLGATNEWKQQVLPRIKDADTHIAADTDDRLSRVDKFNFQVLQDLLKTKTRIYLPGGVRDLSKQGDYLIAGIMALLGGVDKQGIRHKTMSGKEARRKMGRWVGGTMPIGITYDHQTHTFGLAPEAAAVAEAFRAYGLDRAPLSEVARILGLASRGSMLQLLRNDIYRGWLVYDRRCGDEEYRRREPGKQPDKKRVARPEDEIIRHQVFGLPGQEPSIVSDELWQAVQRRMAQQAKSHTRSRELSAPTGYLSGILRVSLAETVRGLQVLGLEPNLHVLHHARYTHHGKDIVRYHCDCKFPHFKGTGKCTIGAPQAEVVNKAVDTYLRDLTTDPTTLDFIREDIEAHRAPDTTFARKVLMARLAELDKTEGRYQDMYGLGRVDREKFIRKQDEIRAEKKEAQDALAALAEPFVVPDADALDALRQTWAYDPTWSPDTKRTWLRRHVECISVSRVGVESIVLRLPTRGEGVAIYTSAGARAWSDLAPSALTGVRTSALARMLGCHDSYVRQMVQAGKIPAPTLTHGTSRRAWTPEAAKAIAATWKRTR